MMKISIEKLERKLKATIIPNITVKGIDAAKKVTGLCEIKTTNTHVLIDTTTISFDTKDNYYVFNHMIDYFNHWIDGSEDIVVIEDAFLKNNVSVCQLLSRIGQIAYTICHLKRVGDKYYIKPAEARKKILIKNGNKEKVVHPQFKKRFPEINLNDPDAIDAIILAFGGIIKKRKVIL